MPNCMKAQVHAQNQKARLLRFHAFAQLLSRLYLTEFWQSSILSVAGLKARGVRTDAHVSVNSVVERMLAAEAEEAALSSEPLPSPETATSPHLPAASKQNQGDSLTWHPPTQPVLVGK